MLTIPAQTFCLPAQDDHVHHRFTNVPRVYAGWFGHTMIGYMPVYRVPLSTFTTRVYSIDEKPWNTPPLTRGNFCGSVMSTRNHIIPTKCEINHEALIVSHLPRDINHVTPTMSHQPRDVKL